VKKGRGGVSLLPLIFRRPKKGKFTTVVEWCRSSRSVKDDVGEICCAALQGGDKFPKEVVANKGRLLTVGTVPFK
jgi:hypothetical protein